MNAFETLIACRNHWQWMEITGSALKSSYSPSTGWLNECACCDFASEHDGDCLLVCPLIGFAWGDSGCISSHGEDICSLYEAWERVNSLLNEIKSEKASRMVYAINKAIEDMIINGEFP